MGRVHLCNRESCQLATRVLKRHMEVNLQVRDIKIDQLGRDVIINRVLDVNLVDEIAVLVGKDLAGVTVLDERVKIERIDRAQFVNTAHNDDGSLVNLGSAGNDPCARSSDETAVREDRMCAQDDLVDTRHQRKDGRVWDEYDGDAESNQRLLECLGTQLVVITEGVAADSGVGVFMVVGEGFGVNDGELALSSGLEKELLHRRGGSMCEDNLVGMDMLQRVRCNLIVDLT